ncbi:chemotaxis protein CheW [Psychromonas antarctica]|jgi:purine-binding chemotaxis protein CheW|uniref:chemotaxis protein CheW n=1 Tax=Psychromonas antarctica TaxID=67573 RepID=UPI001EE7AEF0|nr:chemotaxis protein CheW [Psychromonas antarctica]MCG6199820.1 chemotaxis protein CheW [Psychromonas antarctica]
MKNHNDQAMQSYFGAMLSEQAEHVTDTLVDDLHNQLESLQTAAPILSEKLIFSDTEETTCAAPTVQLSVPVAVEKEEPQEWKNLDVENEFQVLFFELAGLTFAVPLTDLGGIHHLDKSLNSLLGKPDWFSGVMANGESLYNIVDTAKWINTGKSYDTLNYTHYILLGSTEWGLACEKLLGTETLTTSQIKWRKVQGKRPWLAGMVKQKMCALLHADELVKLLNSGINIQGN